MALRIAFVGKKAAGKSFAADYLVKKHKFKRMRVDDAVTKLVRFLYAYRLHKRVTWETRWRFYDMIYKIDPDVQIDYLLRRLAGGINGTPTTRDVVTDDVRYIEEVKKLKAVGYIIVRITPPNNRKLRMAGITDVTSKGTVKLQEYYGQNFDAYPVDYSILNDSRNTTRLMLDKIVDKEREKELVSTEDNNVPNNQEVLIEKTFGASHENLD